MNERNQGILKKVTIRWAAILVAVACYGTSMTVHSEEQDLAKLEAISHEITTLYRSSRKVISDNQALINDASKGDKGLGAEQVIAKTKENYQLSTGKALDLADENANAKQAIMDSVKEVMSEAQDLINQPGVGFKGFLPAVFARQVAEKFNVRMSGKMDIKLTAPKAYVRNRANRPDAWESNIIESQFKQAGYVKGKPMFEASDVNGKPAFRYILPEYYGESCLGCHGTPKGELDISGGKKEGAVLDELGGAVSLTIYK